MESAFYIGDWFVEPQINRVVGPTGSVSLEPRTMRVLTELAREQPKVVTRDELLGSVWEESVVTEHSLTISISDLRKLFGDDPKSPKVIETIRGVGYRLIVPVTHTPIPTLSISAQGDGIAHALSAKKESRFWQNKKFFAVAAVVVVLLALGQWLRTSLDERPVIHRIQPLTSMAGVEISPAFSPDSRRVAFVAFPDSGDVSQIFVQQLGVDAPVKLTDERGAELLPTWSPDGQFIAYLGYGRECALYKKPSFGGPAIKLRDIGCQLGGMAWASDGSSLVISSPDPVQQVNRLYRMDLETLALDPVTSPSLSITGDVAPRFSPDGSTLAFIRRVDDNARDIYYVPWPIDGTDPVRLTHDNANITGYDWTADGDAIVFGSNRSTVNGLWHMDVKNRKPELIRAVSVDDPGSVILARSGRQLVYTNWQYEINTWRYPTDGAGGSKPVVSSTRADFHPHISIGGQLAFVSSRTGANEIWVADADGQNPMKITTLGSKATQFPSWSPDGRRIAFESRIDGQSEIFVVDAAGGVPERITYSESQESRPNWSRDGTALYFGSDRSGKWQVWKHQLATGNATQMTLQSGSAGVESVDGSTLFFVRPDTTGIWAKSIDQHSESPMDEQLLVEGDGSFFSVAGNSLFYIDQFREPVSLSIMRYDLQDGEKAEVQRIPVKPLHIFSRWGFTVSPDASWIYFSQIDKSESDLMLTEGAL